MKVWLEFHPYGTDPDAYLFNNRNKPREAMWRCNVNVMLRQLCDKAGIRRISPHYFRHTRATRAARKDGGEAQICAYFGWSMGSKMPWVYIHMSQRDMEDQVRRDAGIDATGRRLEAPKTTGKDVLSRSRKRWRAWNRGPR